jgi:uncharacterized phage infection (PIP) family protein YhgE
MTDELEADRKSSFNIYDEDAYEQAKKRLKQEGTSISEEIHRQIIMQYSDAGMSEVERLEKQVADTEEELKLAKKERDEAIRRVDELTAHLENLQNRLEQARQKRQTYEEKLTETASKHDRLARDHSIIKSLAREYGKEQSEVRADLEDKGCETYEVQI